ncbi:MAG: hypothetical protein K6D59_09190 [Bacteroidales bacterium]|nr:hypothetical protein [Bacteroidales bacterium]
MEKIIREYRTTPASFDLTGAHPGVDWKGNKNMELCLQTVMESDIDWLALPEEELAKLVKLPEGTRVTRLFYKAFLSTYNPYLEEFGDYDHCDFPDAMARQMADYENMHGVISGVFIQVCAAFIYPNGYEDDCYVMAGKTFRPGRHYVNDKLIITDKPKQERGPSPRQGKPYYEGSPNIGKLLNKAIHNQDWKNPYSLPLQNPDWPLRPNELTTLYDIAVGDITLTIFLGQRGKPPVEKFMVLDSKAFPKKLKEKLLADDLEGKLNDIASMKIVADMTIDGEPLRMERIHVLPEEDEGAWYPPVPLKWNTCNLSILWRADHYTNSDNRIYARPCTEASKEHPNIVKGKPMVLRNLTGGELFPDPIVLDYNNDGLTFQYGKCQYTITPDEPFLSDEKGMNYTSFVLSIYLKLI